MEGNPNKKLNGNGRVHDDEKEDFWQKEQKLFNRLVELEKLTMVQPNDLDN